MKTCPKSAVALVDMSASSTLDRRKSWPLITTKAKSLKIGSSSGFSLSRKLNVKLTWSPACTPTRVFMALPLVATSAPLAASPSLASASSAPAARPKKASICAAVAPLSSSSSMLMESLAATGGLLKATAAGTGGVAVLPSLTETS